MASLQELLAASTLIVTCEKLIALGRLPEQDEQALRIILVKVCRAFQMPTIAERDPERSNVVSIGDHDPEYRRTIETVTREIRS